MSLAIAQEDPESPEARGLIARHLAFAHANTPAEAVYAQPPEGLRGVWFYGGRWEGQLVAIGALRALDAQTVEIKSMHTVEAVRGRGFGRAMLDHLLETARVGLGFRRVVLETGSSPGFAAARALYEGRGFTRTDPYGSYEPGPHNVFYHRELGERPR